MAKPTDLTIRIISHAQFNRTRDSRDLNYHQYDRSRSIIWTLKKYFLHKIELKGKAEAKRLERAHEIEIKRLTRVHNLFEAALNAAQEIHRNLSALRKLIQYIFERPQDSGGKYHNDALLLEDELDRQLRELEDDFQGSRILIILLGENLLREMHDLKRCMSFVALRAFDVIRHDKIRTLEELHSCMESEAACLKMRSEIETRFVGVENTVAKVIQAEKGIP